MHLGREDAGDLVGRTANEAAQRIQLLRIRRGTHGALARVARAINERADVKDSAGIHEMNGSGRRERRVAVLRGEIIRREKAGEQDYAAERGQRYDRPREFLPLRQHVSPSESADPSRRAMRPQADSQPPGKRTRAAPRQRPRKRLSPELHPPARGQRQASSKRFPRAKKRSASRQSNTRKE